MRQSLLEYRKARPEDFQQILDLQNANLFSALDEKERSSGYLSTAFTLEQFERMHESLGISVCLDENKVCGYFCSSTPEVNTAPIPRAMVKHCSILTYKGKPLNSYRFYIANPICIHKDYRGSGAYVGLIKKMLELGANDYDLAVGFVSKENYRNLRAARKLSVETVGQFSAEGQTFWVMVLPAPKINAGQTVSLRRSLQTKKLVDCIGNTPLVELECFSSPEKNVHLFAKLEMFNPSGSIKDRIVAHILQVAEKKGRIKPGDMLVEASSGNTGVALTMIGVRKGYRVSVAMPEKNAEKAALMRVYGAHVVLCPPEAKAGEADHYVSRAKALAEASPGAFLVDQYNNPENTNAHYLTTGPEIWDQTQGKIDILVACASSGGTLAGAGRFLKEKNPALRIILPDPLGSVYYDYFYSKKINPQSIRPYATEGAGKHYLSAGMDFSIIDEVIRFTDEEAVAAQKELVLREGIFAGGSSGAALHVAKKIAARLTRPANIAIIFPDSGMRYLSKISA